MKSETLSNSALLDRARIWAEADVDTELAEIVSKRIAHRDFDYLRACFNAPLRFGTAGLRGKVGPGPARMNLSVVTKVSWALSQFVNALEGATRKVVVGYDARPESREFALCAAGVMAAQGMDVLLSSEPLATPCIAFAVRYLGASAGVVVTASHNPRGDNGYKVFDDEGAQIVAPWDEEISRHMRECPPPRSVPRREDLVKSLPVSALDAYFKMIESLAESLVPLSKESVGAPLKVAYTPLHGVGAAPFRRALAHWPGLIDLHTVSTQEKPDGSFPTVDFPNPEEEGALSAAIHLGQVEECEAVFSNDPDADRFSLCLRLGGNELIRLGGDAVGLLLMDLCLYRARGADTTVFSTIVSSPAAETLANFYGAEVQRTLTGFKWLCHAALEADGFVFAYEEALGYSFAAPAGMTTVMDKDGIAAAAIMARLLAQCRGGEGLARRLFSLYGRIGQWGSFGVSRRLRGEGATARMNAVLDSLRSAPPSSVAGLRVDKITDFGEGAEQRPWYLGHQNLLSLELSASSDNEPIVSARVLIRPSGTEAKLKLYLHLKSSFEGAECYAEIDEKQRRLSSEIAEELLRGLN